MTTTAVASRCWVEGVVVTGRVGRAAVLSSAAALLTTAGCASVPPREEPTPSWTPERVVTEFVDALDDRDAAAVARLAAPGVVEAVRTHWWDADVLALEPLPSIPQAGAGTAADGRAWVVYVPVDIRVVGLGDGQPTGTSVWGYLLARDTPDEPWQVVDQGLR